MKPGRKGILRVPTRWSEVVLVCRKCSKKVRGGFGEDGRTRLDRALRAELGIAKGRRGTIGFVRVDCFGVCPKNAVTVASGSRPQALRVVPAGTPAAVIAAELGLEAAAENMEEVPRRRDADG